ncbi:hypothetical protein VPHK45_0011 [Vibrio phage K45]
MGGVTHQTKTFWSQTKQLSTNQSNNIHLCEINHNKHSYPFDIHINMVHYYLHRTGQRIYIYLIPVLLVSDQTTN